MLAKLNGWKTYLVCAAALIYDAAQYWNGSIDQQTAITMALGALGVAGLRHGISTSA